MTVADLIAKLQELSTDDTVTITDLQLVPGRVMMYVSLAVDEEVASAFAELFALPNAETTRHSPAY